MIAELARRVIEQIYLPLDKETIRRSRNLEHIPGITMRQGGKRSYVEWGHTIGLFQTIIYEELSKTDGRSILDIGCSTGLVALAASPFVHEGRYLGIDVIESDVEFCRRNYATMENLDFQHLNVQNAAYAEGQAEKNVPWNVPDASFDLVTALSVWTHLNPAHAEFYLGEVFRTLRPGGRAIITFFVLDDTYRKTLPSRIPGERGKYHSTPQDDWIFDQPLPDSLDWFYPSWAKVPENALGITSGGLDRLAERSGLEVDRVLQGHWKEAPGLYFQDIVVFHKPA